MRLKFFSIRSAEALLFCWISLKQLNKIVNLISSLSKGFTSVEIQEGNFSGAVSIFKITAYYIKLKLSTYY